MARRCWPSQAEPRPPPASPRSRGRSGGGGGRQGPVPATDGCDRPPSGRTEHPDRLPRVRRPHRSRGSPGWRTSSTLPTGSLGSPPAVAGLRLVLGPFASIRSSPRCSPSGYRPPASGHPGKGVLPAHRLCGRRAPAWSVERFGPDGRRGLFGAVRAVDDADLRPGRHAGGGQPAPRTSHHCRPAVPNGRKRPGDAGRGGLVGDDPPPV